MMLAGAATASVPFVESQGAVIIMSCIFTGVSVAGWNSLDILRYELSGGLIFRLRACSFGLVRNRGS
jgi:hypothetical protein